MSEFKLLPVEQWNKVGNTDGGTYTVKFDSNTNVWGTGAAITSTSTFTTTGTTGSWTATTPWTTLPAGSSSSWTWEYTPPAKRLNAKARRRIIQEVILDHLLRQGS